MSHQGLPATKVMDPAQRSGLYNPNAYVRGGMVEALGKMYGVNAMKNAEREEREGSARMEHHASGEANVPFVPRVWSEEEEEEFKDMVDLEGEVDAATAEENGDEEGLAGLEQQGKKPAVGFAATPESVGEEQTTNVEKEGTQPVAGPVTAAGPTNPDPPVKKPKPKQPRPAPPGTAWFLQRGKELDAKRTY